MTKEEMLEEVEYYVKMDSNAKFQFEIASSNISSFGYSITECFDLLYRELVRELIRPNEIGYLYGRIMNPSRPDVCGGPR